MPIPPLEYLLDASTKSLQELELASLNRAGNLSKVLRHELDSWIEHAAIAIVTRWMMDNREALLNRETVTIAPKKADFFDVKEAKKSA